MKKADLIAVWDMILRLSLLYNSRCKVCHRRCVTGKHFTIDHATKKSYQISKNHRDFDNRLDYYKHLFPIVKANPKEFELLCNACHQAVGKLRRYRRPARRRLYMVANRAD